MTGASYLAGRRNGNGNGDGNGNGNGNGGDDPPAVDPWNHDGAVVREQSHAEVYLLYGGARFHIGSPDELAALGLSWSQVVVVPDGALAPFARMPRIGTLVRDRTAPEVFVSVGTELVWVPSLDAMRFLGLSWAQVHVVPAGSLQALAQTRLPSASATPASFVFPPDRRNHFARFEVPGLTLPNGVRIVELRGWLVGVDAVANDSDPDWHFQLEPDPQWLDSIGVNWTSFYKVGDSLSLSGLDPLTPTSEMHTHVATPSIHVELNGWRDSGHPGVAKPGDWSAVQGPADVVWPYPPTSAAGTGPALVAGQYVRIVGSLVHDIPHAFGQGGGFAEFWQRTFGFGGNNAYNTAAQEWLGGLDEHDQAALPRWTEIHPSDIIEPLPDQARTEAVFGVTLISRTPTLSPGGYARELTLDLRPPGQRPPHTKASITEYVGPETRFGSIVEGNADHSGAGIVLFPDRAQIHVKVYGEPFAGPPGAFKATYRLRWVADPASFRLAVSLQPSSVPAGTTTALTVVCTDPDSGTPLDGSVGRAGAVLGRTNVPLSVRLDATRRRVFEPGDPTGPPGQRAGHWVWEYQLPVLDVVVAGYAAATVTVPLTGLPPQPDP